MFDDDDDDDWNWNISVSCFTRVGLNIIHQTHDAVAVLVMRRVKAGAATISSRLLWQRQAECRRQSDDDDEDQFAAGDDIDYRAHDGARYWAASSSWLASRHGCSVAVIASPAQIAFVVALSTANLRRRLLRRRIQSNALVCRTCACSLHRLLRARLTGRFIDHRVPLPSSCNSSSSRHTNIRAFNRHASENIRPTSKPAKCE